ncbi:MAG: glycosyltransferase family 9 protein [Sulfurifustaceae bacterium]
MRYDYAIVYGFDEPLIRYALRVARRVVAFRQRHSALNDRLYRCVDVPMFQSEHAILSHLRLPAALGVPAAGCRLSYHVTREESAAAQARLAGDVPRDAAPLVGFQVASFPTKGYRDWPIANFADLADRIIREWPRAHFLLYGGSEELVRVNWLKEKLGKRATQYAGRLTLRETAAVMSLTDLYVGVDTGPSHIMSAFDVPLIGMYHCLSSSRDTGALDHPYFYPVDHPRPRKDCSVQVEMAEITVDMVFAQVTRALGRHAPSVARRHL